MCFEMFEGMERSPRNGDDLPTPFAAFSAHINCNLSINLSIIESTISVAEGGEGMRLGSSAIVDEWMLIVATQKEDHERDTRWY